MRTWAVAARATATATIDVEAETEEEAVELAKAIGGFEIIDVCELLDFVVEDEAEAL